MIRDSCLLSSLHSNQARPASLLIPHPPLYRTIRHCHSSLSTHSPPSTQSVFWAPLLITASHASNDALQQILSTICSPSSILFDPRYTSRPKPHVRPPNRTFPPSPRGGYKTPARLPSTISVHNLATAEERAAFAAAIMDKRNPNSFQQLEKLGEGTYATVSCSLATPQLPT